jgi:ribulose-phosphate 3-epimerase
LLQKIKSLGCRAGYAINPGTPLSYIEEVLDELDYILIMAVNPGFAGQTMVDSHLDKLKRIKEMVNSADRNIDLVIDGNTTIENAKKMVNAGATGLVVGTSSLLKSVEVFNEEYENYLEAVSNLKESQ